MEPINEEAIKQEIDALHNVKAQLIDVRQSIKID
jgi:hypothetical protein